MENAIKILREVARSGELSLKSAIEISKTDSHVSQYPLALLIEEDYLGMTISHTPPDGAEKMREFSLATTLHMFTLSKNSEGEVEYMGIKSTGGILPENEKVFIKAKGQLYLAELAEKSRERIVSFVLGFLSAMLVLLIQHNFF